MLVSIAYLTKNGGKVLKVSLEAVFSQVAEFPFEVIAIDSSSTDNTLSILEGYSVKTERIDPAKFNFGCTRDLSFSLCSGDIIIPISQDVVPADRHWLERLVEPLRDNEIAIVQGVTAPPYDQACFYWERIGLFYFTRECQEWISNHDGIGLSFTACAIRREIWEANKIGPVEMSEDKVFQRKLYEAGHKIVFAESALAYHGHEYKTLSSLMKRCVNEGLGWRGVEQNYSLVDMVLDLFNARVLIAWFKGILKGRIQSWPELIFPLIRPVCIYWGNHFVDRYVT